jgi:opacity protein-like surface antigen
MSHHRLLILICALTLSSAASRTAWAQTEPQTPTTSTPSQPRTDSPDPTDPNDHRPAPSAKKKSNTATSDDAAAPSQAKPAQPKPQPPKPTPTPGARSGRPLEKAFRIAGFAEVGSTTFTASKSFEAILDKSSTIVFGGGAQLALRNGIFVQVDITHSSDNGERAFVNNGQVFKLGIPETVEMTPIDITAGYRFRFGRRRLALPAHPKPAERFVPYVGGGVGTVRYKETGKFAQTGDDVDESFTSYNFLAGLEVGIVKMLATGVEFQQRWVPDGLGTAGVSKAYNETDLGGSTIKVKVIVSF